ncbi:hypothetical protein COCVIDRAFT_110540, partial [Bipolaris victoriae FI3]
WHAFRLSRIVFIASLYNKTVFASSLLGGYVTNEAMHNISLRCLYIGKPFLLSVFHHGELPVPYTIFSLLLHSNHTYSSFLISTLHIGYPQLRDDERFRTSDGEVPASAYE